MTNQISFVRSIKCLRVFWRNSCCWWYKSRTGF